MLNRTERLFALAEHLRARRTGVTAEALAERFGVTVRTIYRDLDALRAAALPLSAERGRGGGYALERGYTLPPVNFTAREAALLITLGRFASQLRLLPFHDTLASGTEKLRAALGVSAQRELLTRLEQLVLVGVPGLPVNEEVRAAVEQAFFADAPLRVTYLDRNAVETTRVVRIQKVTVDRRETQLTVLDVRRGEQRQFRLDRILRATLLKTNEHAQA